MSTVRELVSRSESSVVTVAVLTLVLCLGQSRLLTTTPQIQDEFSYLLAADTFSHGRLTNPTHPLWPYFDTTHVLQRPTYQSKYPPGQGLALALGEVLAGSPLVGVWISLALATGAVCWMLQAWLPPPWALLGGVLAATSGGILSQWGGTYMGGAVAMLGGALLFGALARNLEAPRVRYGILLAAGLLVLAISRPFEGLFASLPAAGMLMVWLVSRRRPGMRTVWRRLLAPVLATLTLGFAWVGYYNYRVTGNPLTMPYQVYMAQHEEDAFFDPEEDTGGRGQEVDVVDQLALRFERQAIFHLGGRWIFALPVLVALPWLLRDRWGRFACATVLWTVGVTCFTKGAMPHYSAPITALVIGLMAHSLSIIASRSRRGLGLVVVGVFVAAWLSSSSSAIGREAAIRDLNLASSYLVEPPEVPVPEEGDYEHYRERRAWESYSRYAITARQSYVDRFERDADRHLVVVRYSPGSRRHREWVYNKAEIDQAASVWARWLPGTPLWPLLSYFEGRRVWLLEPERNPWVIEPFPLETVQTWFVRRHDGAMARLRPTPTATDPVRVEIAHGGTEPWHLQLECEHPPIVAGTTYLGRFEARAEVPRPLAVDVSRALPPWGNLGLHRRFRLTEEWRTFSYRFTATRDEPIPRLVFGIGGSDAGVELANVELSAADAEKPARPSETATDGATSR